jgi:integrase
MAKGGPERVAKRIDTFDASMARAAIHSALASCRHLEISPTNALITLPGAHGTSSSLITCSASSCKEFRRDELQTFLDEKAAKQLSFSIVDHLRWDLKQIFDMAVAEDLIRRNPAALLFTPSDAKRPERLAMTIEEVKRCYAVLGLRERLIVQLAIVAGMRPGEIFGLTWDRVGADFVDIRQRVYRGHVDSPKTVQSTRLAALSEGLLSALEGWRLLCIGTNPGAWVFPSERRIPLSRDNILRRFIQPRLADVGLTWVNFQVMRRTHSTLMNNLGVEGKLVADQLGHSLDVNQNVLHKVAGRAT